MRAKIYNHTLTPNPRFQNNVGIVCPACNSEVSFDEIIERKGHVFCVNCRR